MIKVESFIYLLERKEESISHVLRLAISEDFGIADEDAAVVNSIISRDWRVFNYLIKNEGRLPVEEGLEQKFKEEEAAAEEAEEDKFPKLRDTVNE